MTVGIELFWSPEFRGDRVGAFIYAIGSMLVTARWAHAVHISDSINPQFVNNAARNIEKATWLLSQRQDANGVLLLFSNEISEEGSNLSFAVEFADRRAPRPADPNAR